MTSKRAQTLRKYWQTVPKEERTRRASAMAKAKQASMTPEERRAHMRMMNLARRAKKD